MLAWLWPPLESAFCEWPQLSCQGSTVVLYFYNYRTCIPEMEMPGNICIEGTLGCMCHEVILSSIAVTIEIQWQVTQRHCTGGILRKPLLYIFCCSCWCLFCSHPCLHPKYLWSPLTLSTRLLLGIPCTAALCVENQNRMLSTPCTARDPAGAPPPARLFFTHLPGTKWEELEVTH